MTDRTIEYFAKRNLELDNQLAFSRKYEKAITSLTLISTAFFMVLCLSFAVKALLR